jgi:hypothetical protein
MSLAGAIPAVGLTTHSKHSTHQHGFPHLAFQMWDELKPACAVPKPNRGLLEAAKICQIAPPKLLSLNQD